MKMELEVWIEDLRNELESPETTPVNEVLKLHQGSLKALRNVLEMPRIIADNIMVDLEKERSKEDE
jgi:hypothetical protein